jgi:SET domain-containing protein
MPKLSAKEAKTLAVKKCRTGRGIFATKSFLPNSIIFEVTGILVTCNEDEEMDEEERSNAIRFSKKWFISPKGRLADMLNHSCEPTAKVVKKAGKLYIVALTKIQKGTEVTVDYSTILGADDSWVMRCNCNAPLCRKVIQKFTKLPKKLRELYLSKHMVPSYVRS